MMYIHDDSDNDVGTTVSPRVFGSSPDCRKRETDSCMPARYRGTSYYVSETFPVWFKRLDTPSTGPILRVCVKPVVRSRVGMTSHVGHIEREDKRFCETHEMTY